MSPLTAPCFAARACEVAKPLHPFVAAALAS
jgi:hypothetical protein